MKNIVSVSLFFWDSQQRYSVIIKKQLQKLNSIDIEYTGVIIV